MVNGLTLAIPTYNRCNYIVDNLRLIIKDRLHICFQVLIVDNDSTDQTYDKLIEIASSYKNIKIYKNDKNINYFGNFLKIFELCQTKYVLFLSDEDKFDADGVSQLYQFVLQKEADFVASTVKFDNGKYKSYSSIKKLSASSVRQSSDYLSGLLYNSEKVRPYLPLISSFNSNEFCWLYPSVVCALFVAATSDSVWSTSIPVVDKGVQSGAVYIKGLNGEDYSLADSRIRQLRSISEFVNCVAESESDVRIIKYLQEYEVSEIKVLNLRIRKALSLEEDKRILYYYDNPICGTFFVNSVMYMCSRLKGLLRKVKNVL